MVDVHLDGPDRPEQLRDDLSVWVETIKTLLSQDEISGTHPWPYYGNEWKVCA